ncbi:DUF2919 domain-containing protein [Vibrio rumoiensis]|uniref:DUF2919 domain-containing protein n=1 Tax=Vibrio rumoiensis TaxID=76258 RepID=UPI000B5C84CD|nr:DUF2919 domain-containing protein [Vibrio rumoiensis]
MKTTVQYAITYSVDDYDKNGFLKPPMWLWLSWLFLAKAWIVFIIASASRTMSAKLLSIIYPVTDSLYLGLMVGLPIVILAWTISLRRPERQWLNKILAFGRSYTAAIVLAQFVITLYHLSQTQWLFNWSDALTLLGLVWLLMYLFQSQRVKDTFSIPNVM